MECQLAAPPTGRKLINGISTGKCLLQTLVIKRLVHLIWKLPCPYAHTYSCFWNIPSDPAERMEDSNGQRNTKPPFLVGVVMQRPVPQDTRHKAPFIPLQPCWLSCPRG